MIGILDAAKYLIYLSNSEDVIITPLKLQKLLYIAQGWSFVWDDKPLFSECFEAWQYGPVNSEVYNYYKEYGRMSIPSNEGDDAIDEQDAKETLETVWDVYGERDAFELVNYTHGQLPWKKAYMNNEKIDNDDIRDYFQSLYK